MNGSNKEQPAINTISSKSIEAIQTTKSGDPGRPRQPNASVNRRKRWRFAGLIVLMLSGAIPVIGYLLQSETAARFAGVGAALCAIACGGLLVRHLLRVMADEDKLQEEQLNADQATVSPSESNPAGQQTDSITPPPEAGQDIKQRK
jgi:hypothetical protein